MPTAKKKTKKSHMARQKRATKPLDENTTTTASHAPPPMPPMAFAEAQEGNGMAALPGGSNAVEKPAGACLPPSSLAGLLDMIPVVPPLDTAAAQAQTNQLLYNTIPSAPFISLPPPVPHHPTLEELQGEMEEGKDKNAFEEGVLAPKVKNKRAAGCYKQWSAPIILRLLEQGGDGWGRAFILVFFLSTHFLPLLFPPEQQPTFAASGGPRTYAVTPLARTRARRIAGPLLRRWSIRRGGR